MKPPHRHTGPKWAAYVFSRIKLRFPLARFGGIFNCRKIAGSADQWSDHAWGNALDVFVSKKRGDAIVRWLKKRPRFNINYILWQVPDHYDHIHISFNPSRTGQIPPCARG